MVGVVVDSPSENKDRQMTVTSWNTEKKIYKSKRYKFVLKANLECQGFPGQQVVEKVELLIIQGLLLNGLGKPEVK